MKEAWKKYVAWVTGSVTRPDDSESVRIRKTTLAIVFFLLIPVNSVWTLALFSLNLLTAAVINLSGVLWVIAACIYLVRTRNFIVFTNFALGYTFILIFSLQASLGGIVNSGVLVSWGLLAAMASVLVLDQKNSIFWAAVNVVGFVILLAFDGAFSNNASSLPANFGLVNGFFNGVWTTFLAMLLILYLVRELETAQDLADRLLYNVLPPKIAAQLKESPGTIANAYEGASILFADIVGFTPLSNVLSPTEMIELLNRIYSRFDALVLHYNVEKIRTIGDNYMVASGVPDPRPDHAQALSDLALDMLDYCASLKPIGGQTIQFRIGINSGPLIAGVIGDVKYQYDIWGDAVNTASRMESHGKSGKIQITDETRQLLGDDYLLVPRGAIEVKGKGTMNTWFLERKSGDASLRLRHPRISR
jgi:class 3 adenylate cyclase